MGTPTITPLTEMRREGGYVVWDPSDGMITRESIVLGSGAGLCLAGLVLSAQLTGGAATATALGTNSGNGAIGAITVSGAAKAGDYKLFFVEPNANAGTFIFEDPTGVVIGHGNVASPFSAGGISFTLSDGTTDFVSGDSLTISVTGSTKYYPYDPTSITGLQYPSALLWSGYRDATSVDRRAVANVRGPMKVQAAELTWGANVTTQGQRTAALAQLTKQGILSI